MKTNKMMRVASVLLVAVLLTTCAISGTFAKYVTSATSGDSARVAYWGWDAAKTQTSTSEISLDFTELFVNAYDIGASDATVTSAVDVVAPGTANTKTFAFGYTTNTADTVNAPEVDYSFVVDFEATGTYAALDANPNFYWTLQLAGGELQKFQTVALFEAAIEALDGDEDYEAGELPENFTAADQVHTIGWVWEFETADDADPDNGSEMATQDATDTAMGNAAELDDVAFTITITATQID